MVQEVQEVQEVASIVVVVDTDPDVLRIVADPNLDLLAAVVEDSRTTAVEDLEADSSQTLSAF